MKVVSFFLALWAIVVAAVLAAAARVRQFALAAGLGAVALSAHATDTIDITSSLDTISGTISPISLVGGAVFGVFVVIKAWKWVRRAL